MRRGPTVAALTAAIALIATSCGSSAKSGDTASTTTTSSPAAAIVWPAPPNPMELATQAGLVPENAERLEFHVHAHLDVFVNGQKVTVPAGLGIDITNPGVHEFPDTPKGSGDIAYGGIVPPCNAACISPLHTHDVTGILHTESATRKYNTLGQLFTEWGVKLDENCVDTYCKPATDITVYVDGKPRSGDPRTIPLTNYEEIAIVIGTPPQSIPSTGDFSQI